MHESHTPVLCATVLELLAERPLRRFVDGTLGAGGHASSLLSHRPDVRKVIGIDQDSAALEISSKRLEPFGESVSLHQGNFSEMDRFVAKGSADAILLDLGVSSMQLDELDRGFSFHPEAPLDMRMDQSLPYSAADLIKQLPQPKLGEILRDFGGVPNWRGASRAIAAARQRRPLRTSADLMEALSRVGGLRRSRKLHPLTQVMQGLRIAVNDELGNLQRGLKAAEELLAEGGILIVISYHSGEDRLVKHHFRSSDQLEALTKRPIVPESEEIRSNPRSRSAKLRAAKALR